MLIVRSVSVQQLDGNLEAIRAAFPDHSISILTHPHGVAAVEKYPALEHVYRYRHSGPFRFGRGLEELRGEHFDRVVVPVANPTGGGFFNVFLFSFSLPASRRVVCSSLGEISELGVGRLARMVAAKVLTAPLAMLLAVPLVVVASLWLPWWLGRLRR
ncbi:hypothetical protein JCM17961_00580 [Endothiovibrio diazotrophicus]